MSATIIVTSLAVVAAILCFFFWKLGSEEGQNYALQIIIFGFILWTIVLLGKVAVDNEDYCSWLVNNSTVSGSTTSYEYDYTCEENPNSTASSFFVACLWIARLTTIYLVLSFGFELISYFGRKKRGEEN